MSGSQKSTKNIIFLWVKIIKSSLHWLFCQCFQFNFVSLLYNATLSPSALNYFILLYWKARNGEWWQTWQPLCFSRKYLCTCFDGVTYVSYFHDLVDMTVMCSAPSSHFYRNPPKEILITYFDRWEFLKMVYLSFDSVLSWDSWSPCSLET